MDIDRNYSPAGQVWAKHIYTWYEQSSEKQTIRKIILGHYSYLKSAYIDFDWSQEVSNLSEDEFIFAYLGWDSLFRTIFSMAGWLSGEEMNRYRYSIVLADHHDAFLLFVRRL